MKIVAYIVGGLLVIVLIVVLVSWVNMPTLPKPEPDGPLVSQAKKIVAERADLLEADRVLDAGIARPVSCGRILGSAGNPYNGRARYFYSRDRAGTIECFDGDGYSRKEIGLKLQAIDGTILEEIRTNPDLYPGPKTPAPPTGSAATTSTRSEPIDLDNLPNLGTGPCCQSR